MASYEVVTIDSDSDSDADSDIVEIEGPVKLAVRQDVIEVEEIPSDNDDAGQDDAEEADDVEVDEDDDEEIIFDDGDEDEGIGEDGGAEDAAGEWDIDTGIHLTPSQELDAIEKSMEGYDPEADPEYHEFKRKMEEDGTLEYLETMASGFADDDFDSWP